MVYTQEYMGEQACVLENDEIKAICLPKRGGKLVSLYQKQASFELLFRNPRLSFSDATSCSSFADFEACGFDDAFPSINQGSVKVDKHELNYPDHGEIWSADFKYDICGETLNLFFKSPLLGYSYKKSYFLLGKTINITYEIINQNQFAFPCLWAFHCLVNYAPDLELIYPHGVSRILNVINSPRLGGAGNSYQFPLDTTSQGVPCDFSKVAGSSGMEKYYVLGKVLEGHCGYRYPSSNVIAEVLYDNEKLPYLGFWVTSGGFRGDYNCAFEPSNGFYDSIKMAQGNGACLTLNPGETLEFSIVIKLSKIID